ncbi:hypothetical protein LTR17_021778 [Elasticomyces elasticus]|nr:hypothetical protein LTR17_021778 [Elasticomyces elasticus]
MGDSPHVLAVKHDLKPVESVRDNFMHVYSRSFGQTAPDKFFIDMLSVHKFGAPTISTPLPAGWTKPGGFEGLLEPEHRGYLQSEGLL